VQKEAGLVVLAELGSWRESEGQAGALEGLDGEDWEGGWVSGRIEGIVSRGLAPDVGSSWR
jgi:hypothetical protein